MPGNRNRTGIESPSLYNRDSMPATDWGWLITLAELRGWILEETGDLIVLNKPPHVVCHRSRYGPWSSVIGACREYLGDDVLHMPFRLGRETSSLLSSASLGSSQIRSSCGSAARSASSNVR